MSQSVQHFELTCFFFLHTDFCSFTVQLVILFLDAFFIYICLGCLTWHRSKGIGFVYWCYSRGVIGDAGVEISIGSVIFKKLFSIGRDIWHCLYANFCFIGNIFLMETWHEVCQLKFCEEKHPLKLFDSLKLLGYFNQWNLSCTSKLVRLGYFSKEIQFDHLSSCSSWVKSVRGMPLRDLHTAVLQSAKNCFQDIPLGSKWIQIMACCFFLFSRNNNKSSSQQSSSSSSSSSLSSCSSSSALAQELSQQTAVIPESDSNSQVDWTYDPNEPRYCICNQVRMSSSLK